MTNFVHNTNRTKGDQVKTRIASLLSNRRPAAAVDHAGARASQGIGAPATEGNAVIVRRHAKAPSVRCLHVSFFVLVASFLLLHAASAQALTFTLAKTGPGASTSTVQSSNTGLKEKINCGSICTVSPSALITVIVRETPGSGYVFAGWQSNIPRSEAGTCTAVNPAATNEPNSEAECRFQLSAANPTGIIVTAEFIAAPEPPLAITEGATAISGGEATLEGKVNPRGSKVGSCFFEYGKTSAYGSTAPCTQTLLGTGGAPVSVSAPIVPLTPATTYHYRLVALNPGSRPGAQADPSEGEDRTFTTEPRSEPCANAERRFEQGPTSLYLPECRALELISSGDDRGYPPLLAGVGLGDQGGIVLFHSQGFGEPEGLPSLRSVFVADRSPSSGWSVAPMVPDADRPSGILVTTAGSYPSSDLASALYISQSSSDAQRGEGQWSLARLKNEPVLASPPLFPLVPTSLTSYRFLGASENLSHLIFKLSGTVANSILPGEVQVAPGKSNLYEISAAGTDASAVSLVNREGIGGPQIGGVCGAYLGGYNPTEPNNISSIATNAISRDGSVVYFSARAGTPNSGTCNEGAGAPRARIFRREDQATTTEISHSQCDRTSPEPACSAVAGDDRYQGAAADGSAAFFSTTRQLTNSDLDASEDLYAYTAATRDAVQSLAIDATGGTFTLGFGASTTGLLGSTASAAEIESELNDLPSIAAGGGSVAVTGSNPYRIEFHGGPLAENPQPLFTTGTGSLVGTAAVSPVIEGGHLTQISAGEAATAQGTATVTTGSNSLTAVTTVVGQGDLTVGSKTIAGVSASFGAFVIGQTISGTGVPAGAKVEAVGAGMLQLSAPATVSGTAVALTAGAQPFFKGQAISGAGIPAGATITATSGQTVTISANATAAGTGVTISGARAIGSGAEVQGVFTTAADGSRAYFVAKGVLAGPNVESRMAVPGENNLYAYERDEAHLAGRVSFVATLPAADSELWIPSNTVSFAQNFRNSLATPFHGPSGTDVGDGHVLFFRSVSALLPVDTDTQLDLYRYDEDTGSLLCLSCVGGAGKGSEAFPVAIVETEPTRSEPSGDELYRVADEGGDIAVFTTSERLLPAVDTNSLPDAYEWHETASGQGELSLISVATRGAGLKTQTEFKEVPPEGPVGISADGSDIVFETTASLLSSDTDSTPDIYDARVDGGFAEPTESAEPCDTESACREAYGPAAIPASPPHFSGPGNEATPPVCRKGKELKRGKCVAAHHKKKNKHQKNKHRKKGLRGVPHRRTGAGSGGAK
jgi:hypothetical protein